MIKLFKRKSESIYVVSSDLTREYLHFLKGLRGSKLYMLLSSDFDMCLSLYRHSLCVMLGLKSRIEYSELEVLVNPCVNALEGVYDHANSELPKESVIQACAHCISLAKERAREAY